jgi:tyrosinase
MNLAFSLNDRPQGPYYVGYTPVLCSLKITDGVPGAAAVSVQISNNAATGGQLVFYPSINNAASAALSLLVPGDGTAITFYIGGKYNAASTEDGDAGIKFSVSGQSRLLVNLMVRVRKDANGLTPRERDRFLNAFVKFATSGKYENFLAMHSEAADGEIHGRASFLPWHRIFVLDLERHLQEIDASVAIPYWNFQYKADKVFTPEFMGVPASGAVGHLVFSDLNPLNNWRLPNLPRLDRRPVGDFKPLTDKALVEDESVTLGRGPGFYQFRQMEGNPHGSAHVSWTGPIDYPPTAPQDPLFFMLHANVDRLWAAWQFQDTSNNLFKSANSNAYKPDSFPHAPAARAGDFTSDTMWPWNEVTGNPRPATAPGGTLINSPFSRFPGKKPTVADTIDYQGKLTGKALYFDYDALPYKPVQPAIHEALFMLTDADVHMEGLKNKILEQSEKNILSKTQLDNATNSAEIVTALSNSSMITDDGGADKAIGVLRDTTLAPGERVLALSRLIPLISSDQQQIDYILQLVADTQTAPELRRAALRAIKNLGFSSPIFTSFKPEVIQVFRGMIHDPVQDLREEAIAYLAKDKDEFVQRELIKGLEEPDKALIPEELAIHLLGYDIHAGVFPILRKIVDKSSSLDSRAEAIHLLGGDLESKDLLLNIFNNKKERFDIRKSSLLSLKQQHPETFVELARNTVIDHNENENIRALSINALEHSNIDQAKPNDKFIETLKNISVAVLFPTLIAGISSYLKQSQKEDLK